MASTEYIEQVKRAYVECALWSSLDPDNDGDCLDAVYDADDIAPETLETMAREVVDFLSLVERKGITLEALEPGQVGHDFWLTRNGHGAGFWDRGLGELGEALTRAAETFGESYLYTGDDGKLYVS
jgi:hypothetical protein